MQSSRPNTFKVAQLNAENLFLFLDEPRARDWRTMSEGEWKKLSAATVDNKPLKKLLWLADSLLEIDADVVCLNEVGGLESIHNFAKLFLNDLYVPHLIEGNSDRGIDVGYLIKKTLPLRCELRTHKERPLGFLYPHDVQSNAYHAEQNPERVIKSHYFSRDCSELRLYPANDEPAGRPALILMLVHLKSKLDPDHIDPQGRQRRAAEVKTLVEVYNETRAEFTPPVPTLVAGDFNGFARPSKRSEEFVAMANTDLASVSELAGLEGETATTQIVFSRSSGPQFLEIDFIFTSPELKDHLIPAGTEIFRYRSELNVPLPLPKTYDQRLFLPSDHYPVVATFNYFLP